MSREEEERAKRTKEKWAKRLQSPLYIFSLFLSLALFSVGLIFYRTQEKTARIEAEEELAVIADLKVRQVENWLKERLTDVKNLAGSPLFAAEISHYFQTDDAHSAEKLRKHLKVFAESYGYANILVLDVEKNVRMALKPSSGLPPECRQLLDVVATTKTEAFSDLHRQSPSEAIHLAIASLLPLPPAGELVRTQLFILFTVNAENFLFPLIQSWPLPSKTAETLLVRRKGDEVIFLNELRHRQNTALSLKFPLTRIELPAVRAVLGQTGLIEGKDHRGEKVLAFLTPVPQTSWSMVAQIDAAEALGPWRTRSLLIILVILGILAMPVGLSEALWQREEKARYRQLYQAEAKLRESEDLFRVLNESSLAGVYLIQDGLLRYVNQAAAELFGYKPEELIDKLNPLVVVHPKDKALVAENIRQRLEGKIQSLRYEFLGQRKDGSILNVEVFGSLINYRGRPAIIGTLIDISERKRLLEETQKREAELRSTLYSIGDGVITTDTEGRVLMMNPVAERLTGWREEEAKGQPLERIFNIINEFTRLPAENPVERVRREGVVVGLANHSVLISRRGEEYPVADSGAPVFSPEGKLLGVVLVFRDQTEERQAQRRLEEAKEFAESIVATMYNPLVVLDPEFRIVRANQAFCSTFQVKLEDIADQPLLEIEGGIWDIPVLRHHLEQLLPKNTTFEDLEITIPSPRVGPRLLRLNGRRLYHKKNQTKLILLAMEDVTARRKAEEALKKSEKEKTGILEAMEELVVYQAPDHSILWANRAAAQSVGLKPEELVGCRCYEIWHGRNLPCEVCPVARARETGQPQQDEIKTPDGRYWFIRGYPLADEQGKIIGMIEATLEVTEKVKVQLALKASEERFRRLAENAQDLIYRYRLYPERGFEYVSPAATAITGYTPEEHYADPDLGLKMVVEEDRPLLEMVANGQVNRPVIIRWRRKDGAVIWTEQRNVFIYDDEGRLVAIEGIARDVTERMKIQAALEASLREKEILLREIHHRVKNNMQVISSLLNLQARHLKDKEAAEMFRQAQKRIRSMAMVHEKLYHSQDLTSIDFTDYLKSLAQTIFQDYQQQRGQVKLHIELEPVVLNINQAVPVGLMVNELVTNSLKHAFPWGRKGNIWVRLRRGTEKQVIVQVKDDGVGFPANLDPKTAESMGMIIITTLVNQLDGKLELRREGGTDIRITFPSAD
ncbi:MAG: PAS domain S-box protein [Candidatus Aminicenantales bacterium]